MTVEDAATMIAHEESSEIVIAAIRGGISDINEIDSVSGWSLLDYAVEHMRIDIIEWLIANGADVNLRGSDGGTALHHAVDIDIDSANQSNRLATFAVTRCLLFHKADRRIRTHKGRTPRDWAASYGEEALERFDAVCVEADHLNNADSK